MEKSKRPNWAKLIYTKSQVIKAGKVIRQQNVATEEYTNALEIIDNWRASHAYPMYIFFMHLKRMTKNQDCIVAQRLKRLDSITTKLQRQPTMSLWSMQDLGGCRLIVSTIDDVYTNVEKYRNSRKRHMRQEHLCKDYIKHPKLSGYRGIHEIYQYHSDKREDYNDNFLIELQFRTKLQHLWATAVESMGLFTQQAIKSGQGTKDVNRFFALISSLFAREECQPLVPNTPEDVESTIREIRFLDKKNNYLEMLNVITGMVRIEDRIRKQSKAEKNGYYILILNYKQKVLNYKYYPASQIEEANKVYTRIEQSKKQAELDAVLVMVSSFDNLKDAYPNYFADISEFIKRVKSYIITE